MAMELQDLLLQVLVMLFLPAIQKMSDNWNFALIETAALIKLLYTYVTLHIFINFLT